MCGADCWGLAKGKRGRSDSYRHVTATSVLGWRCSHGRRQSEPKAGGCLWETMGRGAGTDHYSGKGSPLKGVLNPRV